IIAEENEKLKFQIEQALSVDAVENSELKLHKTLVNIEEAIDDALKLLVLKIENTQARINKHIESENLSILGDKVQMVNVFKNLIDNAIKYSNDIIVIDIYIRRHSGFAAITIADKGIGIAKKHQKKIFKKYFRVPSGNLHAVKGSGIGLAYVHEVVGRHKGKIKLESELEKGSTFTLYFPYEQ
ncbi:MAG TPA: ATP-binding protein, partial [Bacteroidia bacterium]